MKKSVRFIFVLLAVLLLLCGCTGKKKEEEEISSPYDLGGKTYYNTVDEFGNEDHAKIWFGKDGTFVLKDNFSEGIYEVSGNWTISENVVTLDVIKTQIGDYFSIKFEIQDEETLLLKTTLAGSKSDDVFSINEVKGSTVAPVIKDDVITLTYTNANQTSKNRSQLLLSSDGTFIFKDQNDFGITEVNGTFEETETSVILKDITPAGALGEGVNKIEFTIYDNDTLILITGLGLSQAYDLFTRDGKIPEGFVPQESSLWVHRKNDMVENELYLPTVEFDPAGTFVLTENVFAGMAQFKGWYEEKDGGYICHVVDASQLQGFNCGDKACDALETIEFAKENDKTLLLMSDLCLSRKFDVFDLKQ